MYKEGQKKREKGTGETRTGLGFEVHFVFDVGFEVVYVFGDKLEVFHYYYTL